MKTKLTVITFCIVALAFAASDPGYHLLKTIPLTGDGARTTLPSINPRVGSTSPTAPRLK
jgi:hypothetical protein